MSRLFELENVAVGEAPDCNEETTTDEIGALLSVEQTTLKTPLVNVSAETLSVPEHESFAGSNETVEPIIPAGIITVNEVPSKAIEPAYEVPLDAVLNEALVVEKLGNVLVEQLTPTVDEVEALRPDANSVDAHCVVEIFDELKEEEASAAQRTLSFPLESVVSAETRSVPEQLIVVPKVNPITPLGNVTLKLLPS